MGRALAKISEHTNTGEEAAEEQRSRSLEAAAESAVSLTVHLFVCSLKPGGCNLIWPGVAVTTEKEGRLEKSEQLVQHG